jgi:hypothetical protein
VVYGRSMMSVMAAENDYFKDWRSKTAIIAYLIALGGVAIWIWTRLFVILVYGPSAYFLEGIYVTNHLRSRGVFISNGDVLAGASDWGYRFGMILTVGLVMFGGAILDGLLGHKGLAIVLILLYVARAVVWVYF